jgi:hypothetical protein
LIEAVGVGFYASGNGQAGARALHRNDTHGPKLPRPLSAGPFQGKSLTWEIAARLPATGQIRLNFVYMPADRQINVA